MSLTHRYYPHFSEGRFANYAGERHPPLLSKTIVMFLRSFLQKKVGYERLREWGVADNNQTNLIHEQYPVITWIGHSTFLITLNGVTILTDPVFGNLSFLFPRLSPAGLTLKQLPHIDVILISHNHPDHMDAPSLKSLEQKFSSTVLVPQGNKPWFDRRGFKHVHEFMWWDTLKIQPSRPYAGEVSLTFLPAVHWSQRNLFDRNRTLWGSWMIQAPHAASSSPYSIYFAGDTAYGKHFSAISQEYHSIHVALIPIAPCEPSSWMRHSHVSAEEAGQAFLDLKARQFIPMHWGTYWLGIENPWSPVDRLFEWWYQNATELASCELRLMKFGQSSQIFSQPSSSIPESQAIIQELR